jgi:hypothetical protein
MLTVVAPFLYNLTNACKAKSEVTQEDPLGKALALLAMIRLAWKCLQGENALTFLS